MIKSKIILLVFILLMTGCASSTSLKKQAENNVKAAEYYKSIGQPQVAEEEYKEANKNRDSASQLSSILVDLFNLFTGKGK
ncbi:hypothetical protein HII17_13355 [Thalassotalea sp. M1531]|uniref:DUF4398 domain-containing protein n=1 Tax=Thalassotalea algicola TaxID=2716224 RepID=A0A7Y0LE85_9GAMM|nr:hypothetical protein [Thalassotalea algicola]NMP32547.1 hypothetical protein [Thalassotalea algicola]